MKRYPALLALATVSMLGANRLAGPLPYNPAPALPPQSTAEDARKIAAAEAKRARKAARVHGRGKK